MFGENFWKKINKKIKFYNLNFLLNIIGYEYLSPEEIDIIEKTLNKKIDKNNICLLDKIFTFGKVSQQLGIKKSNSLSEKDIDKYIKDKEIKSNIKELDKIKKQAYLDIFGKQYKIEKDLRQLILNEGDKNVFSNIFSSIKKSLEDWSNLKQSISYISESTFNEGKVYQMKEDSKDKNIYVYKLPVGDERTCRICKSLYLNNDGSPKIYKLSVLESNGTNIGIKNSNSWKAVVGQTHIHCRCILQYVNILEGTSLKDYYWNGSDYVLKEENELNKDKVERKSKVKITIGDKVFEV